MTTFEKLRDIIADQLARDKSTIQLETSLMTDLKADSLEVAEILFAIEDTFNISLDAYEDQIINLKSVQDIVTLIDQIK